jgi:hypothetical protein
MLMQLNYIYAVYDNHRHYSFCIILHWFIFAGPIHGTPKESGHEKDSGEN